MISKFAKNLQRLQRPRLGGSLVTRATPESSCRRPFYFFPTRPSFAFPPRPLSHPFPAGGCTFSGHLPFVPFVHLDLCCITLFPTWSLCSWDFHPRSCKQRRFWCNIDRCLKRGQKPQEINLTISTTTAVKEFLTQHYMGPCSLTKHAIVWTWIVEISSGAVPLLM